MAKKSQTKDLFTNLAYASVTESAANTLTFAELNTGVSVHEKIAWVINRIDWFLTQATTLLIVAAGDGFSIALTSNNQVSDIEDLSDPSVIALIQHLEVASGTPAVLIKHDQPYIKEYSSLPGGGLIITPKPLYIAAQGISLASAGVYKCRIYYTVKELAADEFWELVQASRIVQ